ncbi:MAG: YqgE/AlgH family protein [Alphaproteobacteria bacterium]|nr:YqgE/AlgH family protein [Alphaproteobacteria bacterium]
MKLSGRQTDGLFLILLAGLFFWFPYYLKQLGTANHKILVATEKIRDGKFEQTVILILHHSGYSALGFVLNKPPESGEGPNFGGPVNTDAYYTLHSFGIYEPGTILVSDLQLGYTEGEDFAKSTVAVSGEHIVFKGVSSWGRGQLSGELHRKMWKVIDYDHDLVFHTDPQKMWDIAIKRPTAQKTSQRKPSPEKSPSSSDISL